jgi:hypothetical protein
MTKRSLIILSILAVLPFAGWCATAGISYIQFDRLCTQHIERAGEATDVEIAASELEIAMDYLRGHNMTSGYTSIIYRTPDEDLGFKFQNYSTAENELKSLSGATELEKTNALLKLRESIHENGTMPDGAWLYPYNLEMCCWAWASGLLAFWGIITILILVNP